VECPTCGFQQPEEEYCARCGVRLHEALKRRQRRTLFVLLTTIVLVTSGALGAILWLARERSAETPPHPTSPLSTPSLGAAKTPSRLQRKPTLQVPTGKTHSPPLRSPTRKRPERPLEAPPAISSDVSISPTLTEAPEKPEKDIGPLEAKPTEPDPEGQIRRWAAQEWFVQGQELADNSEEELALYYKALEVDPHFAPAYYFIGVIQLEWGNREAALEALRRFWQEANEEERQEHPLPETLTLEELGLQAQPDRGP
jgi:hypothetical protein